MPSGKADLGTNLETHALIDRISVNLATSNLALYPIYVPSSNNKADQHSRGVIGDPLCHIPSHFTLPRALRPFLSQV